VKENFKYTAISVLAPLQGKDDRFQENVNVIVAEIPPEVDFEMFFELNREQIIQAWAVFFALQPKSSEERQGVEYKEYMKALHQVFGCLCKRLETAGEGDVYLNAVVVVQSLSLLFSLSAPELIQQVIDEGRFFE